MSIFTSLVTERLDVPHDPGQSITIRKLNPGALRKAMEAAQERAFTDMARMRRLMGDAAVAEQLASVQAAAEPKARDPLLTYDRESLMASGVVAWTYDRPTDPEAFADLDDGTSEWLARSILTLARPALFQTEDEAEAARKNA